MLSYLSLLPLLALVSAQATQNDIALVEANFEGAQLVPEFLSTFTPQGTLGVTYNSNQITTGQNLTASEVSSAPSLTYSTGPSASAPSADDRFTVILADADIVGTDESTMPQTRHWLVNGASVAAGSSGPYTVEFNGSTAVGDYVGPGPLEGTGSHRYVLLMYAQPSSFSPPANLSTAGTAFGTFFVPAYVQESGLGDLVAANYFQVENGVATVTVAATTAVNTATLSGAASTTMSGSAASASAMPGSMSGSMSHSSAASRTSGSSSASSAPATSSGAAVSGKQQLGWGVVVGAVGVAGVVVGAGLGF